MGFVMCNYTKRSIMISILFIMIILKCKNLNMKNCKKEDTGTPADCLLSNCKNSMFFEEGHKNNMQLKYENKNDNLTEIKKKLIERYCIKYNDLKKLRYI